MNKKTFPYGSWESPITPRSASSGSQLFELKLRGDYLYIAEIRHDEDGRYAIVRVPSSGGKALEITPQPFNARSTVHEYGGGCFVPALDALYFSNFSDQRLYKQELKEGADEYSTPIPITLAGSDTRYADGEVDHKRGRLISVRERHPLKGKRDAVNSIVAVDLAGAQREDITLLSGNDFYAFPRLNRDGSKIAWITWNFPNMPFDGSELWVGEFDRNGNIVNKRKLAGGLDESVTQPIWSPSGDLYFISDRTGWWNLYRWRDNNVEAVYPKSADFAHPDWNLGLSTYGFASEDVVVCTFAEKGIWRLSTLNTVSLESKMFDSPFTNIHQVQAGHGYAVVLGGSPTDSLSVHRFEVNSGKIARVYPAHSEALDPSFISLAEQVEFPTSNNLTAYAFYYAPKNPNFSAPPEDIPPLVVAVHGGPTSATTSDLKEGIQFWTTRGFAVLDVNYGGSSGYGREYRRRLNGQWGIVDVDDCVNGAMYLVKQGKADPNRMVIRGGSAGGFTTMASLAFRNVFKAGAALYGISDLELWELEAHKFESDYCHSLVGAYPEEKELFHEHSPVKSADKMKAPLIMIHGLEDRVCPPNQSEVLLSELRKRKHPVAYITFEGEQHNFRKSKNIERDLALELSFFAKVLVIKTADALDPIRLE